MTVAMPTGPTYLLFSPSQCLAPRPVQGSGASLWHLDRGRPERKRGRTEESVAMAAVAIVDFVGTNFATSIVEFENSRKAPSLLCDTVV